MGKKHLTDGKKQELREILNSLFDEDFKLLFKDLESFKGWIQHNNPYYKEWIRREKKDLLSEDLVFLKDLGVEIKYEQIQEKGLFFYQSGNYADAFLLFDITSRLHPRITNSWFGKAISLYGLSRFEEAVECYNIALKYADINYENMIKYIHCNKALALLELNRYEEFFSYLLIYGAEYLKKLTPDDLFSYFENLDHNQISLIIIDVINNIYIYQEIFNEDLFNQDLFFKLGTSGIKILIAVMRNYSLVDKISREFDDHINNWIQPILIKFNTSEYKIYLKEQLFNLFLNYYLSEFQHELKMRGYRDKTTSYYHTYLQQELWDQIYEYLRLITSILNEDEIFKFIGNNHLYSNPTFTSTLGFAYNEIISPKDSQAFSKKWLQENHPLITYVEVNEERIYTVDGHLHLRARRIANILEIKGLEKLKDLKVLDLASNKLSKIKGLENLNNLHTLLLDENQISKIEGLDSLRNLRVLHLSNNNIMKIEGLDSLKNLEELDLSENKISKIRGLNNLTNLKVLHLRKNKILKIKGLKTQKNLKLLNLENNNIDKINGLNKLISLRNLWLFTNNITEIKNLDNLKNLEELILGKNQIVEIKGLKKLHMLNYLNLERNRITEVKGLDELENLKQLYLDYNLIFEINGLKGLKNLRILSLKKNKLTEIKDLDNLKNLEELTLDKNKIIEIKGLRMLKNLKKLSLNNNKLTEIKGLEDLVNLDKFSIDRNKIAKELLRKIGFDAQDYVKYCQQKKDN